MGILPGDYDVNAATWFYLSLLLIVAVFFRFTRLWSLRNFDLALLLSLSPGLLLLRSGREMFGYVWLFVVSGLLLLRLYADGWLQRRPRMEQNLNAPGLGFLCVAAFVFLSTEVITAGALPDSTVRTVDRANGLLERRGAGGNGSAASGDVEDAKTGPAASVLAAPVVGVSKMVAGGNGAAAEEPAGVETADLAARITAILAHLAVMLALMLIGHRHFGDFRLGLAMATLYLLLPATSYDVGRVNHVLPAALIAWAVVAFRRPIVAGCLLGLACGTLVFPVFLLPLWLAFYERRGAWRFGAAVVVVGALLAGSLALTSENTHAFTQQIIGSIDWKAFEFRSNEEGGFWSGTSSAYRIPVQAGFLIILVCLTIWPRKKSLEHLIAHSAAIVVAIQFWYPRHGGEYVLWYLPLVLMVVLRPRLAELLPPDQASEEPVATRVPAPKRPVPKAGLAVNSRLFR